MSENLFLDMGPHGNQVKDARRRPPQLRVNGTPHKSLR